MRIKSIDILCASPASTAICSSMEQYTMVRHAGTMRRQIDRRLKPRTPSCSSELPFDPRPHFQKGRKSSASHNECRRKSSADVSDLSGGGRRRSCSSPQSSSRYLLSENPMFEYLPYYTECDPTASTTATAAGSGGLGPYKPKPVIHKDNNKQISTVFRSSSARNYSQESPVYRLPSTSSATPSPRESPAFKLLSAKPSDAQPIKSASTCTRDQVVELRVSIHCKGCEGKVRKHLSKMEGVRSFSIDLVSKKVTVIGNVTPLSVLASISKVKNAQFWPSPTSSSSPSSSLTSSSSSSSMSGRA